MKPLVLALVVSGAVSVQAQGTQTHTVTSDPFTIELPVTFVYLGEAEVSPTLRIHNLREGGEESAPREVLVLVQTGLSPRERRVFAAGSTVGRGLPQFTFTRVSLPDFPIPDGIKESARSAFLVVNDGPTVPQAGVLVRGCVHDTCYQISAEGVGEGSEGGMAYASLLSGFRFAH